MGNGTGGKTVYINYNGEPLRVQTPEMSMPFGLTPWPKEGDGTPQKYSLELSFKDMDSRPAVKRFYDMLCDMDQKILEEGMANSEAWFKRQHKTLDVTDAVYKRMLKIRSKNDYPPIFKVNVPFRDGKIMCDTFDENKERIDPLQYNLKGARVMAIIQCTGIWLAGGNFGCSWRVLQMRVVPSNGAIEGFAFDLEDEEEEKEKEKDNGDKKKNNKKSKTEDVDVDVSKDSALMEDDDELQAPIM